MIHPLIKVLATRPDLLADHVGAYAALIAAEAVEAAGAARHRLLWAACAAALGLTGLGLAAVAGLLAAALPWAAMPAPWLLPALPALCLLAALLCQWRSRQAVVTLTLDAVREQWALDAALIHRAGAV